MTEGGGARKIAAEAQPRKRISVTGLILIAFLLGLATGLFLGESAASLQIVGRIFFQLLQMTILPYITFSLVSNIGALSPSAAKAITTRTGRVLLFSWLIVLILLLVSPLGLPRLESASFFSTSVVAPREPADLLAVFIPSNPFRSLANNVVPAVVLFSIALGIALMGLEGKDSVLAQLKLLSKALARVSGTVAKLTPIGVFGITASAAGTLTTEDLGRIQAYLILLAGMSVVLVFWIFPMAISMLTGLRYGEIMRHLSDALVVAFSTDSIFIALPLISEGTARLLEKHRPNFREELQSFEVVLPVLFSFPHAGKILLLLFVVFAGWYSDHQLALNQFPAFALAGIFSLFGTSSGAILFLLDYFHIPVDLFQLNVVTGLITGRIASACGVMHLFTVALLSAVAVSWKQFQPLRLVRWVGGAAIIVVLLLAGTRLYLDHALRGAYDKDRLIAQMRPILKQVPAVVHREIPATFSEPEDSSSRLKAIRSSGVLRVGYLPDALPWSYFNAGGELVGLDVEMAHLLASELGVRLEFIPTVTASLSDQLDRNDFDVAMAPVPGNTQIFTRVRIIEPYLEVRLALVVPDHRREEFESVESIRRIKDLRIGLGAGSYFAQKLHDALPNAEIVPIGSQREFFEKKSADALLASAEGGSAWTLLYPAYSVVVPVPSNVSQPLSYAVARNEAEFGEFLDHWVHLKKSDGTVDRLREHWILGKDARPTAPRWSILRNVFGWKS